MRVVDAPLRLGLVGCGRLAEVGYLPAIERCPEVELAAVVDPDPGRRDSIAALAARRLSGHRRAPVPTAHAGVGELLASDDVDAVIVAVPVAAHRDVAAAVAAAGMPCLVEKPPAADAAGAEAIASLDPAPWIGFNRRFEHGLALLDAIPAAGPLELQLDLRYRRRAWRAHSVDDDALLDLAPHLVDLALVLTGSPTVTVRAATLQDARATLELETGRGTAWISCATNRPHVERAVVRRPGGERLAQSRAGGLAGLIRRGEHPLVGSLRRQLSAFAAACRGGGTRLLATAEDGVRTMRVIDTARAMAS